MPGLGPAAPKRVPTWSSCAILNPAGAQVGTKWPCWAEVGRKAIHMGPKLKPCDAHRSRSHVQSGATWALWRQLHTNLGPTETQHAEHCFKRSIIDSKQKCKIPVKKGVLRMSDWAGYVQHVEAIWTSTLAEVAPTWARLRAKLQYVGAEWVQVGHI